MPDGPSERLLGGGRAVKVWLRNEHLSPAERLDRLAGDAELVATLRAAGFAGQDWDFFVEELARYGIAVISGWLRAGVMQAKCAEKRIRVPALPETARRDVETLNEIALETVAEALNHFRDDVLVPGVWDPNRGAALKTFFVGQCMKRYANVVRRAIKHDLTRAEEIPTGDFAALDIGRVTGVEDDVIRTITAQNILRGAGDERAARALALDACGFSNAEIAADLNTTLDGSSSLIKRARARIRKQATTNSTEGTA
jgi:hypothetical protein